MRDLVSTDSGREPDKDPYGFPFRFGLRMESQTYLPAVDAGDSSQDPELELFSLDDEHTCDPHFELLIELGQYPRVTEVDAPTVYSLAICVERGGTVKWESFRTR